MNINHPCIDALVEWASREKTIRALVVTGSLARHDGTTDRFSDLDVPDHQHRYQALHRSMTVGWTSLGEVWIRFPTHEDVPYRLVWFSGGYKVDFQFLGVGDFQTGKLTG